MNVSSKLNVHTEFCIALQNFFREVVGCCARSNFLSPKKNVRRVTFTKAKNHKQISRAIAIKFQRNDFPRVIADKSSSNNINRADKILFNSTEKSLIFCRDNRIIARYYITRKTFTFLSKVYKSVGTSWQSRYVGKFTIDLNVRRADFGSIH